MSTPETEPTAPIAPAAAPKTIMESMGGNTFLKGKVYYGRFHLCGRRTWRKLASINKTAAKEEVRKLQSEHDRSKLGLCPDPLAAPAAPPASIANLAEKWLKAGCPDRKLRARTGSGLENTHRDITRLIEYFGPREAETITIADCDKYHLARLDTITRGTGHRTVELELCTLSNLINWAVRAGHCRSNPLVSGRPSYRPLGSIRSCNEVMPETDEELHRLANYLFRDPQSEALGWQLLLEALTGCRTQEILRLRWDAAKSGAIGEPGYQDATCLYVARDKRGIYPYILLEPIPGLAPLRECLAALKHWHDTRAAQSPDRRWKCSPWYLPGKNPSEPLEGGSLTQALARASEALKLPHRTSHGLRAFHARALRALGIDDSEIAKRLGQRSGVGLIERVYGRSEPGWFGSKRLDFLPEKTGKPTDVPIAWAKWLPQPASNIIPMDKTA